MLLGIIISFVAGVIIGTTIFFLLGCALFRKIQKENGNEPFYIFVDASGFPPECTICQK